jgi:predicted transcriptional regulator
MRTLIVDVSSLEEVNARVDRAVAGDVIGTRRSFVSADLLLDFMTSKRLQILKVMTGAGPISIRELSRRIGRDVKAVHGDVQALIARRFVIKTDDGKIEFPFDEVRVNFVLSGATQAA